MMTVREVSRLTGVSVRALHHYDRIGLLKPSGTSEGGYRLYDEDALARLQQILLFMEHHLPVISEHLIRIFLCMWLPLGCLQMCHTRQIKI